MVALAAEMRLQQKQAVRWWRRAVVSADDAVQVHDDDGSQWVAENDL